ncbi:MAG: macro domain-containing protein [Acidobacteriota bacterium]
MERRKLSIQLEGTQLELAEGDITELDVDAVVNAANEDLQLGAGVAGAILEKGGPSIQEECDRIGHTPVGTAVLTGGGNLQAQHVIHAVGPQMGEGEEDRKLQSAVRASLALADRHGLKSIAIPAISTGVFGFPMDRCARILLTEVYRYLQGGTKIERVVISLKGDDVFEIFKRELRRGFR